MKQPLRYLSWIITVPLAVVMISFAVSNREPSVLRLWPLPFEAEMPAFLPVLCALVIGFVAGGLIAWWSGRRTRRMARRQRSRLKALTEEVEALRAGEAKTADAETRQREAERLSAAARAAEISAKREEDAAPPQLAERKGQ